MTFRSSLPQQQGHVRRDLSGGGETLLRPQGSSLHGLQQVLPLQLCGKTYNIRCLSHAAARRHLTHGVDMLFLCHFLAVRSFLSINIIRFCPSPLGSRECFHFKHPYHVALTMQNRSCLKVNGGKLIIHFLRGGKCRM